MKRIGKKFLRVIAAAIALAAILALFSGCCGLLVKRRRDNETSKVTEQQIRPISLTELTGSTDTMIVNDREDILFTVRGSEAGRKDISIVMDDSNLGPMTDDGTGFDETAGDGIYTASITVTSDDYAETVKIVAASGQYRSDPFLLHIYAMPTEAEVQAAEDLENALNALRDSYGGEETPITQDEADNMLLYAKNIVDQDDSGLVESSEIIDNSLEIRFACGGIVYLSAPVEGLWSAGDGGSMKIITLEPWQRDLKESGFQPHVDSMAEMISAAFPNYGFSGSDNQDWIDVTLDDLDRFGPRQLIIWEGHGDWKKSKHSYVKTHEKCSLFSLFTDKKLYKSWNNGEIVFDWFYKSFTAKYVDKYVGDMTDSVILFVVCRSGMDSVLADAFLKKGASAVTTFSEYVDMEYSSKLIDAMMTRLTEKNGDTGRYYTLGEALKKAQEIVGYDDTEYKKKRGTYKKYGPSEMLIFGGEAAESLRLMDDTPIAIPETETEKEITVPENESETEEEIPALADGLYQFRIRRDGLIPYGGGFRTKAEKIVNVTVHASRVRELKTGDMLTVDGIGSFEVTTVTPTWIGFSDGSQLYPAEGGEEWILAWPGDAPYTRSAGSMNIYIPPEARIENWLSPQKNGETDFWIKGSIKELFEDPDVGESEVFSVLVQGGKITSVALPFHP